MTARLPMILAFSMLAWPMAGVAQSPSVDDLIRDLKPRANSLTRGIRPVAPAAEAPMPMPRAQPVAVSQPRVATPSMSPAPVAPAPAPAPAAADTGQASASMLIQFERGSDRLTPAAMKELDKLGRALSGSELSGYKFRIEGHTDAVGSREMNLTLSERRATAAVDYIVAHYRVDRSRLTPVGMGFMQMAVPTAEGVSEPRNRRVQIVNVGA